MLSSIKSASNCVLVILSSNTPQKLTVDIVIDGEVVGSTAHLSDQAKLKKDIACYIDKADVVLTELKAAAIKVVTKEAVDAGISVVYCDNIPLIIGGDFSDLEKELVELVE